MLSTDAGGIAVAREQHRLLEGVPLAINAGDVLLLRGSNGCGKTTLLETLAGLLPRPAALHSVTPLRELTCYIPVTPFAWQHLSPPKVLAHWEWLYGRQASSDALLDNVAGLLNKERPLRDFSAGQQQRIALLELGYKQAPLWLLDEPIASLDTAATEILLNAVRAHCRSGGAAIIASHQPWPAAVTQEICLNDYAVQKSAVLEDVWL